ncbi:Glycosyl transferase [Caulifigura coniformis]|uniref:Lipid-A-disaccharide synthase n=1 Tax=Caulifigura coniformis TaxID=2527983 RepID=A0A517SB55_9PLAN|nr:lipid-A-disaccharide synthase [Caulifigura coniformis]QDT53306.1 Glycosyl transferase [Caulifigura coniformis]
MHVFFSVGEPSADQHGAHLIAELRRRDPSIHCSGFGGPLMEKAGFDSLFRLTDMAVMGVTEVLPMIPRFYSQYLRAKQFLRAARPDVCVLIDFPGFNWWIASAAKEAGIEVIYYCPPQMWAWAGWRIRKMRRLVDRVLSVLPFEADWYNDRGMPAEYVGHPFYDEVAERPLDREVCRRLERSAPRRCAILPGSRNQEVRRNFPMMLDVVERLARKHPDVRFPVACFRQSQRQFCENVLREDGRELPVDFCLGETSEIIATADCILMVSGSVSLEVLSRGKPATAMYRCSPSMYLLGRFLGQCDYMSLPNMMVNRPLMPEFPLARHSDANVTKITAELDRWLSDPVALQRTASEMRELAAVAATRGGISRAVDSLLRSSNSTARAA